MILIRLLGVFICCLLVKIMCNRKMPSDDVDLVFVAYTFVVLTLVFTGVYLLFSSLFLFFWMIVEFFLPSLVI